MAEIIGGELLVRCLHAEGVQFIHAITDGTYMMVIEALSSILRSVSIAASWTSIFSVRYTAPKPPWKA